METVYTVSSSPNSLPVELHIGSIYQCNCLDCRYKGYDEFKHLNASNAYAIRVQAKATGTKPIEQMRIVQKKDGVWGIAYFSK